MLRAAVWILLGAASCIAIFVGLYRHRPARRLPWLLVTGAVASLATGDVLFALHLYDIADFFYLSMFVLVASALWQFTRQGSMLGDRTRLIDMLAFATAAMLVVWVLVIGDRGDFGATASSDILGSLLLIGVAVRLRLATGRNSAAVLLLVGSVAMMISNIVYPLWPGHPAEAGYVIFYVTWGLSALQPSMIMLTEPRPPRLTPWRGRSAALLGVSVATPPAVLLIESLRDSVDDGVVIAVAAAITLTLAITRLTDSVTLSRLALRRERSLREASASLVAAADLASVDRAVRDAVAELVPAPSLTRVALATDNREPALATRPTTDPHRRSWWTDTPPAASATPTPPPISAGESPSKKWWGGRLRFGRGVTDAVPSASAEATLVCPLWLEPLAVARPSGGALILTGRRGVIDMARDSLEVLAGQAALALDRISLVDAVGRRDSDLYLRAVIRNTAELMLVIDDDRRIRYASPALHELLGVNELSPLATLEDLVHPDDKPQIRRAFGGEGDGTLFCGLRKADEGQILVEATYRDLRQDRLVQGFVVTMRNVTTAHDPVEQIPQQSHMDELPAWVNRRSAQHKFRY